MRTYLVHGEEVSQHRLEFIFQDRARSCDELLQEEEDESSEREDLITGGPRAIWKKTKNKMNVCVMWSRSFEDY